MDKKTLGTKIKALRVSLGITQKELAGEYMTRNMLSLIELGSASPSLETAQYIAKRLGVSLSFLLSEGEDNKIADNFQTVKKIRELYSQSKYCDCLSALDSLSEHDFETNYVYAYAAFYRGKELTENGSFSEAERLFNTAIKKCGQTPYDTAHVKTASLLYLAICKNVQSPLLELDIASYESQSFNNFDYELYKYLTLDFDFEFSNPLFKAHAEAKLLIKKYRLYDAIKLLNEIEDTKNESYNAFVFFGVYTDLEGCYKQLGDFENAYRYSSKRLSLINAFSG